ncbi:hypothetical protein RRG08_013696 [Elysia crispata]|uniref:VWFA domain-containing protein n=1 Tax=Elysia crispata TaxID=231223 RepID=A0AAE0ZMY5_9GAST|nr:hypothetical protein RRG08_013696 [Elysia crispata]
MDNYRWCCCHGMFRAVVVSLCLVAGLASVKSQCFQAEIALVLDVSESTRVLNLTTDQFQINPDYAAFLSEFLIYLEPLNNRVGIVSYSTRATIESPLTSNFSELTSSLSYMVTTAQFAQQNTDTGIDLATDLLIQSSRPEVHRYMVVFLDGISRNPNNTRRAVVRAGESNITIISVSLRGDLQESVLVSGRSFSLKGGPKGECPGLWEVVQVSSLMLSLMGWRPYRRMSCSLRGRSGPFTNAQSDGVEILQENVLLSRRSFRRVSWSLGGRSGQCSNGQSVTISVSLKGDLQESVLVSGRSFRRVSWSLGGRPGQFTNAQSDGVKTLQENVLLSKRSFRSVH